MDQIADDRIQPGIITGPEMDNGTLTNIQLIDGCLPEEFTIDLDPFRHLLPELFFHDLLHGTGNEIQVTFISHLEFDLVPYVGEQRPAIVVNRLVQHEGVGKLYDTSGRMLG